jgi:hypothetical protein
VAYFHITLRNNVLRTYDDDTLTRYDASAANHDVIGRVQKNDG